MKSIKKASIVSAVGGSILIADNVFDILGNQALAQTQDAHGQTERQQRAGSLAAVLNLLLFGESVVNDRYITEQNSPLTVASDAGVLSNDDVSTSDTVTLVQDVQHGALTLNADGSFAYLPDVGFVGNDSFVYRLSGEDAQSQNTQATVTIKVNGQPVAVDDDFIISNATGNTAQFLDNIVSNIVGGSDVIVDGADVDPVTDANTTLGGTVSIQANGDFQYTPPANLGGQQDSYVYTLRDRDGDTDTATITWQANASITGVEASATVAENDVLNSTFTLFTPNGLDYLDCNGTQFTSVQLSAATPSAPLLVNAEVRGEFTITGFAPSTGVVSYQYDPNGSRQDHSGVTNDLLPETITLAIKDTELANVISASLLIQISDTNPQANNDSNTINEGVASVEGNSVEASVTSPADVADVLIDSTLTPVVSAQLMGSGSVQNVIGNTDITGNYGVFSINQAGLYTYTLDNTLPAIRGLKNSTSLSETLNYTIQDSDGDTASATVTVTINGTENATPTVDIVDANGLATGDVSVAENATITTGTVTLTATAGFAASGAALTITDDNRNATNLSLNELNALSTTPFNITGLNGELSLIQFDANTGVLSYNYNPNGNQQDHRAGPDSIVDKFRFQITDNENDTSTPNVLDILIADTAPTAIADTPSIGENTPTVSGNAVFSASATTGDAIDTLVDSNATPVSGVAFGVTVGTVGSALNGDFGSLTLNNNGLYSYALDTANATVQALKNGGSVQDSFTYTIEDGDGSTASSTVTVSITGVDDPAPVVTVADNNGAANGQLSVTENQSASNQLTLTTSAGLSSGSAVQVTPSGGPSMGTATALTTAQLNALSSSNVSVTGAHGTLVLTHYDANTGLLSYTFNCNQGPFDHSGGTEFIDAFAIALTDLEGDSGTKSLSINVVDAPPMANDDDAQIGEKQTLVSGNAVGSNGAAMGDVADQVDALLPVSDIDFGPTDGTVGADIAGRYGTFNINTAGQYSYALNNATPAVLGLKLGQSLTDVFTYTLTDSEAQNDTGNVTVTINGVEDPLPTIAIVDNNGAISAGDEQVAENATLNSRTLTLTAAAGLAASGTALTVTDETSTSTQITLAQLNALSAAPVAINGAEGTLTLTGFNANTGVLTYGYDPTGTRRDHSAGDNSVLDDFDFQVTDNEGDNSAINTLGVLITDTAPTAASDTHSLTEDAAPNTATGDVITNDTQGADTSTSVSNISFASTSQTVGAPFTSTYGSLDLNSDGTYTYTLNNGNGDVQALKEGESLTEVFTYTISDTDADTSTTTLTVTINGADEPPEIIIPNNGLGPASSDASVVENATINGSLTINAEAGLRASGTALSVTAASATTPITLAQLLNANASNIMIPGGDNGALTLTNYNSSTGLLSYAFDPINTSRDHSGGDNSVIETYSLIATDDNSDSSSSADLDILIADTVPTANDDNRTRDLGTGVIEGQTPIAGNAVGFSSAATGDNQDTFIDPNGTPVIDIDFGSTDGTPGSNLASAYGTFNINNSGVYTYTLDNTNPTVQGLKTGEFLREEFVYTIVDGDGDTDTATLTVDIDGVDDPAPTAAFNAAAVSGGFRYTAAENTGFSAGQLTLTASAGLLSSGTALQITPQGGSAVNISLSTLQAASPSNTLDIVGSVGTLSINGVSLSGFNTTLSFAFEVAGVPGSFDHSSADPAQDIFAIAVTDNEGDMGTTNVEFRLTDTAPTAAADVPQIDENTAVVTGNVITGGSPSTGLGTDNADTTGADTSVSVSQVSFMSVSATVGSDITSAYGSMDINADGTYTYTLDNLNTDVQNLDNGQSLTEVFGYTIDDTDGDSSSTTVTVTINGVTD